MLSKKEQYNSWFRGEKDYTENKYEAAKRSRQEWPEMDLEEIREILEDGYVVMEGHSRDSIMDFMNEDTFDTIKIQELGAGLQLMLEKEILTGLTTEQYKELRKWSRKNLEEKNVRDLM